MAYFSTSTTNNFLSRDACIALGIVPKGFPFEQINVIGSESGGDGLQTCGSDTFCTPKVRFKRFEHPMYSKRTFPVHGQNPPKSENQLVNGIDGRQNPPEIDTTHQDVDDPRLQKLVNEFAEVFDKESLPPMDTEPMVIKLKDDYVSKAITVARKVPYARREDEIKEIRKLESDGIIEAVGDRPTEFCSPTICPVKPDGSLRFATDFTYLNKQVSRTVHPAMSSWDAIHSIDSNAKYYSTFDSKKGYWQVPLAEESKDLTTFLYPIGKFRYTRAPMGFISIGIHTINVVTRHCKGWMV